MKYGLIGEHLGHSYSREIHEQIADYTYELKELAPDEVAPFLRAREFAAINVTIPYKQTVMPFLDEIDAHAQAIGAVNTVVNRDGKLYGYNTDFLGVKAQLETMGLSLAGKKVMILGSGGTSQTARAVAKSLGAREIVTVSRTKTPETVTYEEALNAHTDAQILFNCTPVGMFPRDDASPITLDAFGALEGVFDAIYHPLHTDLVQQAQKRNIPASGGLYMLSAQAVYASALFLGKTATEEKIEKAYRAVKQQKSNVVLIGMPASGKSTVGKKLAHILNRPFYDTDTLIEERIGMTIAEFFAQNGEQAFRAIEKDVIAGLSQNGGAVIATGGGAILDQDNVRRLKHNGTLFFLDRDLASLRATKSRPLSSDPEKLKKLYEIRMPLYRAAADVRIISQKTPGKTAQLILKEWET